MTGLPDETHQTLKATVKFAKSLNLDYVQFSKTTAKPLTGLWRDLVKDTGYDYWREYILGNTEETPLPRPWTKLTNDEIDTLTKKAYVKFHSRPCFLFKHVMQVRSFDEFKRKFLAWCEMRYKQEDISIRDDKFVAYEENKNKLKARQAAEG